MMLVQTRPNNLRNRHSLTASPYSTITFHTAPLTLPYVLCFLCPAASLALLPSTVLPYAILYPPIGALIFGFSLCLVAEYSTIWQQHPLNGIKLSFPLALVYREVSHLSLSYYNSNVVNISRDTDTIHSSVSSPLDLFNATKFVISKWRLRQKESVLNAELREIALLGTAADIPTLKTVNLNVL
jgi:hypothetical protein